MILELAHHGLSIFAVETILGLFHTLVRYSRAQKSSDRRDGFRNYTSYTIKARKFDEVEFAHSVQNRVLRRARPMDYFFGRKRHLYASIQGLPSRWLALDESAERLFVGREKSRGKRWEEIEIIAPQGPRVVFCSRPLSLTRYVQVVRLGGSGQGCSVLSSFSLSFSLS